MSVQHLDGNDGGELQDSPPAVCAYLKYAAQKLSAGVYLLSFGNCACLALLREAVWSGNMLDVEEVCRTCK